MIPILNQVQVENRKIQMIQSKVECINVIGELRVKLIANQVKEMSLGLKEMKAKVECIGVKVSLLTKLPSTLNSTLMPPPRATFQKPILFESKNQFLHMKVVCFILLILNLLRL